MNVIAYCAELYKWAVFFWNQSQMNNYRVMSYRDVIVVTKIATRRSSKAQSIAMY